MEIHFPQVIFNILQEKGCMFNNAFSIKFSIKFQFHFVILSIKGLQFCFIATVNITTWWKKIKYCDNKKVDSSFQPHFVGCVKLKKSNKTTL